jgi:hypothetical protein
MKTTDNTIHKVAELLADYGQMIAHATHKMATTGAKSYLDANDTKKILIRGLVDLIDEVMENKKVFEDQMNHFIAKANKTIKDEIETFEPKIEFLITKASKVLDSQIDYILTERIVNGGNAKMKEVLNKIDELKLVIEKLSRNLELISGKK